MIDFSLITQSALRELRDYMDDDLVAMLEDYGEWNPGEFLKTYMLEDPDFKDIVTDIIGLK